MLERKLLKLNIEEVVDCCKLYTTVGVTKWQGRSFKRETNWVSLSKDGKLISSTALLEKLELRTYSNVSDIKLRTIPIC